MRLFIFFIVIFACFKLSAKEESAFSNIKMPNPIPNVANDTLIFDLEHAVYSTVLNVSYIDLPIVIKTSEPVNSFDFRMKFNQSKMTFVSTNRIINQLDPFTYFDITDDFLRNGTSGPYVSYEIPNNTPLIFVRFKLSDACTSINESDFFSITTLFKGYNCQNKVTTNSSLSSITNLTSGAICSNNAIPFNSPSVASGKQIGSYFWNLGNGTTSTEQNPTVVYNQSGTYTVKLVTTATDGCKDSVIQSLVVDNAPMSNFSYLYDNIKDSVFFTNIIPVSGSSNLTWQWDFGDFITSTEQDPVHHYNTGGDFTVTLTTITIGGGCSNTFTTTLFIDKPTANFTTSKDICNGETVIFNSTSTYSGNTITAWEWDFGDNTTSTLENPTHIYSDTGSFIVKLIVTGNTGSKADTLKTIIINNKPIILFEGDVLSGCSPLTVNFTDNSTADNGSTYSWDFEDSHTSIDKNPTHIFLTSRTYSIKEIITTPGGCRDSLIINSYISVLSPPSTDFSTSIGCVNSGINFTDKSTVLSGNILSRAWNFGDNTTSSSQNPVHVYNTVGTYIVTLITTSNFGCVNMFAKTIIINTKPIVQFSTTNLSGCTPLTTTFDDNSTTVVGSNYKWDFGDNSMSQSQNPSYTYPTNGSFTVKEVITAPGGCADSVTKIGYINVLSAINTNFFESNLCENSVTNFTDSSIISSGTIVSWNWNFGNGNSSTVQNPNFVYTSSGNFDVTLNTISDQGCTGVFTKNIKVDPQPKADFNVDKLSGCVPETINFIDFSTTPSNSTYSWEFGDGTTATSKNSAHIYSIVDSFTVKFTVTSPQGCIDSIIKDKLISLKASPISKFEILTSTTFIPNLKIDFSNKSEGATSYLWNFGDYDYTSLPNPKHAYIDSGEYEICLTASSSISCFSIFCDTIRIISSSNIALPTAFSPNGDGQNDVFQMLGGPCVEFELKIFNEIGNMVFISDTQENGWDGIYKNELQPAGSYNYTVIGKTIDNKEFNLFGLVSITR